MKFKILLLDDEQWVIRNMLDIIDWASYRFEIVGTETNSLKGFEMLQRIKPDLVLVDIRMPEMSGLELIKKSNELNLKTVFIVISGFAEFSYVQKCINLGAIGYCLKPIEEEEIAPLLRKAHKLLNEKEAGQEVNFFEWMLADDPNGQLKLKQFLHDSGLTEYHKTGLRVIVCLNCNIQTALEPYKYLKFTSSNRTNIYIVEENGSHSVYSSIQANVPSNFSGIGISSTIYKLESLKMMVEEANMLAYQYFMTGQPTIYQKEKRSDMEFSEFRKLSELLQKKDINALNQMYDEFYRRFRTGKYQIKYAFFIYTMVLTTVFHAPISDNEIMENNILLDYEQLIERYQDVYEMIQDLKRMTIAYLGNMFDKDTSHIGNEAFITILQYINDHYDQKISLQYLSDKFYMNSNYISQLFIKYMKTSYTNYLAELRIQHACHLLKTSQQNVQEIGVQVGFNDVYYFSKCFKKITGMTAGDFRRQK